MLIFKERTKQWLSNALGVVMKVLFYFPEQYMPAKRLIVRHIINLSVTTVGLKWVRAREL